MAQDPGQDDPPPGEKVQREYLFAQSRLWLLPRQDTFQCCDERRHPAGIAREVGVNPRGYKSVLNCRYQVLHPVGNSYAPSEKPGLPESVLDLDHRNSNNRNWWDSRQPGFQMLDDVGHGVVVCHIEPLAREVHRPVRDSTEHQLQRRLHSVQAVGLLLPRNQEHTDIAGSRRTFLAVHVDQTRILSTDSRGWREMCSSRRPRRRVQP